MTEILPKPVDTLHTVETPEGALLQLTVAGPVVRAMAWSVDVAIRLLLLVAIYIVFRGALVADDSFAVTMGIVLIVQFALAWLYTTVFEAVTGTTPGKRLYRLWVVHDNATPLTAAGSIIRNFLRAVDSLPFFNITGVICMLIDNRFRRLGDLAAGTLVVYRDKPPLPVTFHYGHSVPPPSWLSRDERQAIVDFAERSEQLSAERQKELACQLSHLMEADSEPVDILKSWAQWILRGQSNAESAGI